MKRWFKECKAKKYSTDQDKGMTVTDDSLMEYPKESVKVEASTTPSDTPSDTHISNRGSHKNLQKKPILIYLGS